LTPKQGKHQYFLNEEVENLPAFLIFTPMVQGMSTLHSTHHLEKQQELGGEDGVTADGAQH
jgi:hypothetical protein